VKRKTPFQVLRRLTKMGSSIAWDGVFPHFPPDLDKPWYAPVGKHAGKLEEGVTQPLCGKSTGDLRWQVLLPETTSEQSRVEERRWWENGICPRCQDLYEQHFNVEIDWPEWP
jgi:hypothetical protein